MAMLKKRPDSAEALASLPGMPRPVAKQHGARLLEAIQSDEVPTLSAPRPRLAEETVDQRITIDSLWAAINATALARSLAPPLLASRNPIAKWVLEQESGQPMAPPDLPGWRGAFLRQTLGEFLAGGRTLELAWRNGRLEQANPGTRGV